MTWDPPDGSDIDYYMVYVPSQNIMNIEPSAIAVFHIQNCHDNVSIQVAAVNRFGCIGPNSPEVKPSLLTVNRDRSTTVIPIKGGSTTIEDGSPSTSSK